MTKRPAAAAAAYVQTRPSTRRVPNPPDARPAGGGSGIETRKTRTTRRAEAAAVVPPNAAAPQTSNNILPQRTRKPPNSRPPPAPPPPPPPVVAAPRAARAKATASAARAKATAASAARGKAKAKAKAKVKGSKTPGRPVNKEAAAPSAPKGRLRGAKQQAEPPPLPMPEEEEELAGENKRRKLSTTQEPLLPRRASVFVRNSVNEQSTNSSHVRIDTSRVFALGQFRYVYRAIYDRGPRAGEESVAKIFKTGCVYEDSYYDQDIKAVKKAGELIEAFNKAKIINKRIYLNEPEIWTGDGSKNPGQKLLVEPMIKGEYFKFNSNTGYAAPDTDTMQALSHFSFHQSGGKYLICDLQGGRYKNCYVLTDPVIMSHNKAYGGTDIGQSGIDNFMAHHQCGRFCNPNWLQPKVDKLVPTMRPVTGTTFGAGKPLFSKETVRELQAEVRRCWQKALASTLSGKREEVRTVWNK
eukprot:TRINITY_DN281_c0_g1_i1.p1 TRINITY_DN281_c0_g1~~TRINITY_DN281_c0_g1_i1.p1  ORF type:complete len:469 (-),score=106.30 TRINITY_DN281_c0_g1_i1:273-1679(-)